MTSHRLLGGKLLLRKLCRESVNILKPQLQSEEHTSPGKEPKEGERKIYLAIESANELAVQKAKAEITRLIKEELIRLQNSYQPTNKGRYKVL